MYCVAVEVVVGGEYEVVDGVYCVVVEGWEYDGVLLVVVLPDQLLLPEFELPR